MNEKDFNSIEQIFDWLREQIREAEYNHAFYGTDFAVNTEKAIDIIDEAEAKCSDIEQDAYERGYVLGFDNGYKDGQYFEKAKWEAECCEWHYAKGGYYKTVVASPHKEFISLKTSDLKSQPYCGHCGKPIKISEVE